LLKIARATGDMRVENANVIAVTSALKGEGKTFTCFNLAMSIATERDVSVLLIDGDLFARSLSHLLGLDQGLGLADMLAESQIRLDDIIVSTNVPKLRVVPAGHIRHHATELLASERMRHAVRELASRYSDRIILLDTAPILLNSEAMLLEALVGQVLVVVQEGKTPQHAIQDALSLLGKKPVTGMVLNRCLRLFEGEYSPYYGGY
jgi:exopolysaccharide/PEP-CTERM locus tyrosine autokinase